MVIFHSYVSLPEGNLWEIISFYGPTNVRLVNYDYKYYNLPRWMWINDWLVVWNMNFIVHFIYFE